VLSRLEDLVAGRQTREEAANWAAEWVNDTDDVKVDDFAVWEALTAILGADLISTDRPYLYGPSDFADWAERLRSSK